jgi:SSS family solute:Na+ symporter
MVSSQGYTALAYTFSVACAVAVAVYAFVKGYLLRSKIQDTEAFITARGQVGWYRVAWSFYAGAVGAWVITSPAGYASFAGMLGLCMYALAAGAPFLMIAYGGDVIRKRLPHVLSLTDFMGWRYGEICKATVCLLILFNMSIALLAEYYTIGTIFTYFVRSVPYAMVIVVGVLTLAYTAYGGLLVSIFTDTIQGIASVLFFFILALYMAITFRPGYLPQNTCFEDVQIPKGSDTNETEPYCFNALPCAPSADGSYPCVSGTPKCSQFDAVGGYCPISGYSSILTMPLALFAATVFSEAMWQRCWASSDTRNVRIGAWVGAAITIVMVWFAGFTGLLTVWAQDPYLTFSEETVPYTLSNGTVVDASQRANYDLYLFQVLYKGKYPDVQDGKYGKFVDNNGEYVMYPSIQNWIGVILVVLAVVMNEGAVDSIQNGMAAAVASYFQPIIKQWNLWYTRGAVVLLNAALVGIGAWLSLGKMLRCPSSSCF